MKIFDFDTIERLEEIKTNYVQVKQIKNSLADHRDKYRELTTVVDIDQTALMVCLDYFERALLINCYTFSEQLVKNFVYEILGKDRHTNEYLNLFLNSKIPKEKFSPNASTEKIERLVSSELFSGFKFVLNKTNESIKKYDEMIKSRHKYAHRGIYDFDFGNFDAVIDVLEFIAFELITTLGLNGIQRKNFQKELIDIRESAKTINKCINNKNIESLDVRVYRKKLKELKLKCKKFHQNYNDQLSSVVLFGDILNKIIEVASIDLRSPKSTVNKASELHDLLSN